MNLETIKNGLINHSSTCQNVDATASYLCSQQGRLKCDDKSETIRTSGNSYGSGGKNYKRPDKAMVKDNPELAEAWTVLHAIHYALEHKTLKIKLDTSSVDRAPKPL